MNIVFQQSSGAAAKRLPAVSLARLALGVVLAFAVLFSSGPVLPLHAEGSRREYEIKAAFLYNFIKYVDWPEQSFPKAGGTLVIGILGENPFGPALAPLNGKTVKGCTVKVLQAGSLEELRQAQMIFISPSEKERLPDLLQKLGGSQVLTVSEIDGFAERGGIINFIYERNKVRFEINSEAARRQGLTISSELLKLARQVKT